LLPDRAARTQGARVGGEFSPETELPRRRRTALAGVHISGVPGLKTKRAWVGDAPHAMRDPLGFKSGVYKACGLEIKDGGAPARRRIAGAGRSAMPGPIYY